MAVPIIQTSFAGGEISPSLWGHVDYAKARIGLTTCRNGFISYRGGYYSRAGTKYVGFSKQTGRSYPPRLITFQFSINQGLCLEFGNLYMRVISNGEFVTEDPQSIVSVTRANPGTFTVTSHGYSNGDWVVFPTVVGMTQLLGIIGIVANATTDTFTLTNVYGTPVNTTSFGVFVSGTVARIYTLVTPYSEVDLNYLKFTQSADVMTLTCVNQVTGTEYAPYDLARNADDDWSLTQTTFAASISAPTSVRVNAQSSTLLTTYYGYVVTAIDKDTGEESPSSAVAVAYNNDIGVNQGSNTIHWKAVNGAESYNVYKCTPSYGVTVPAGVAFGYMTNVLGAAATDSNIAPDFSLVPPIHTDPFARGAITQVRPTANGMNYSQDTIGYTLTTSTGSGFAGSPVVADGEFVGFVITNGGENYAPSDTITITDSGGGVATGTITWASNPSGGSNVVINGVTIAFINPADSPANAKQVILGSTLDLTLQALANLLNSTTTFIDITVAQYISNSTTLTITYKTPGTAGNAFTIDGGTSGGTPSGATLTGGGTAGSGGTATLSVGPRSGTYPGCCGYFQQRRVYAYTANRPDTYFMSRPGAFTNFDSSSPTTDNDAIIGTPWSVQVNGIQWLISMPGGLVTLTGKQAWQLTGVGGSSLNPQPITPASQQAQPQDFNGASSTVVPQQIGPEILYVQAKGSIVRDLSYNYWTNIYTGTDITYLSSQLFTGYTMGQMAWCEEPYKLVWVTRNDGTLLCLTYLKQQEVMAWSRHDTNGQFWSVTAVTEPPVDALYLATQRYPGTNNCYMIERMDDRLWDSIEDCWCVDAGLSLTQPKPNATLTASSATGAGIPTGVTNLVGGSGYSAGTTGQINDPTGSGAAVTLTIVGGIITGVHISGGSGYTYPVLQFNDPAQTGVGASATVTLDNSATFSADTSVFVPGSVGNVIRMGGGIAKITQYTNGTTVTANITSPIVQTIPNSGGIPVPATSGNWTLTTPVTTVSGLNHLIGATVTGLADGKVIPPTVVAADGTITLSSSASSVTVGLGFTAQAQSLYLDAGDPTQQGRRKKIAAVTARFELTYVPSVQAGTNQPDGSALSPQEIAPAWSNLTPFVLPANKGLPPFGSDVVPLYTGDVRVPVSGGFATPGQVALQQSAPVPLQILDFVPEFMPGDDVEMEAKPHREAA